MYMNKFIRISAFALLVFLPACKNFEPMALDDSAYLALDELPDKGIPVAKYNKGYIDDFRGDINMWWVANEKIALQKVSDTLKVVIKEAGSKYECWGREFSMCDFTENPVLKIRARFEGNTIPSLTASLKDVNAYDANSNPPTNRLKKGGYQDYYFDFSGKWKQGWPEEKKVDQTTIREILFFINRGGADWTGTIYIDEIKAVKVEDMPARKTTTPTDTSDKTTTNTNTPAAAEMIDDFSNEIYSWWSGSDKIKLAKEEETLNIELKEVGPGFETWGRGFNGIDFNKTPVVKVRMKATDGKAATLRIDIKDSDGSATNGKPTLVKFEPATEFADYYFDFTGKYEQSWPDPKTVNPAEIVEIVFMVNPAGELWSGTLVIDDISVISLEEYKNKK
jgi:hypothetical protein